jgi:hypothetical protein
VRAPADIFTLAERDKTDLKKLKDREGWGAKSVANLFAAIEERRSIALDRFVFALGMGALLVLLGTFSGILAGLPKSGRWLLFVKRGFGVLMVLAGGYFLLEAGRRLV